MRKNRIKKFKQNMFTFELLHNWTQVFGPTWLTTAAHYITMASDDWRRPSWNQQRECTKGPYILVKYNLKQFSEFLTCVLGSRLWFSSYLCHTRQAGSRYLLTAVSNRVNDMFLTIRYEHLIWFGRTDGQTNGLIQWLCRSVCLYVCFSFIWIRVGALYVSSSFGLMYR